MGHISSELTAGRLEGFIHLTYSYLRLLHRFGSVHRQLPGQNQGQDQRENPSDDKGNHPLEHQGVDGGDGLRRPACPGGLLVCCKTPPYRRRILVEFSELGKQPAAWYTEHTVC